MLGVLDLIIPPTVLLTSVATLPFTLLILLTTNASGLTSTENIKHAWFKHFWWWFGPATKPLFEPRVAPLLTEASGVVLDIGPASGIWMQQLGAAVKQNPGKIKKIYGVEPNKLFHAQLQANARQNGLADIYEPVAAYAQDLESLGIKKSSVDTIITVHVLCSVGDQQTAIIKSLYEYLKPGGLWLVYEHVASPHTPTRAWQSVNNVLWSSLLDGCDLMHDTEKTLTNAVEWDEVSIGPDPKDGYFETLPHTVGKLIKKR